MSSINLPQGFVAKIGRAKEHLDALKSSIESATVEGECYAVVKEANQLIGFVEQFFVHLTFILGLFLKLLDLFLTFQRLLLEILLLRFVSLDLQILIIKPFSRSPVPSS